MDDHENRTGTASGGGMSRRAFLATLGAAGVAALGTGFLIERHDTYSPGIREVVVPVAGLPRALNLVQASDLHSYRFGAKQSAIAKLLSGVHVDAAVLTGDLVDGPDNVDPAPVEELIAVLRARTKLVYALRGNHDPQDLVTMLVAVGAYELRLGEPVPLAAGVPLRSAALVYGREPESIAGARDSGSRLLVIASHTPPDASRLAAGEALGGDAQHLYICGHTHGGQIRLPLLGAISAPMSWAGEAGGHPGTNEFTPLPDLRGRFVDGMYERGRQRIFVSHGLGDTWIHGRFLCRSEIVLYRFVPAG